MDNSSEQPAPQGGHCGQPDAVGLYMHVPFCFHKCHYCDFYSIVDQRGRMEPFTERLIEEIAVVRGLVSGPVRTIFIGGGTPTLLLAACWERLLGAIGEAFLLGPGDVEFTVEANPETVTPELAGLLVGGGVNRISIGAQSFNPQHLRTLERHHDPVNVQRSVDAVRAAGIGSINIDLIFGVPGQTLEDWHADLERVIDLAPEHVSCYALTYEPNTPLSVRVRDGRITPIEDEIEAAMYESAMRALARAEYEHYEISAWARPDHQCRHNLIYWRNQTWWALGPSAAGHVRGVRWKNVPRLAEYLACSPWPPIFEIERPDPERAVSETLMMGLRLREGIERNRLEHLLETSTRREQIFAAIRRHIDRGWLQEENDRISLTHAGLLHADTVLVDLV